MHTYPARLLVLCLVLMASVLLPCMGQQARTVEPPVLLHASPPSKAVVQLPDGQLCILYMVSGEHCASIRSSDDGQTWSQPRVEFGFKEPAGIPVVLVDQSGELHAFLLVERGRAISPLPSEATAEPPIPSRR